MASVPPETLPGREWHAGPLKGEAVTTKEDVDDPATGPEERLGAALRRAREERGVSLRALAKRLYRSHSNLVEYERGHRLAPLEVVEAYEAELGLASQMLTSLHERAQLEIYGEDRSRRRTHVLKPALHPSHQLPPDIAEFTGREGELTKLRIVVARPENRRKAPVIISAIAGMGGVGKTALAVHLAHELAPEFPDAQLYVNLHGYEPAQRLSPANVLDRFLRALGVPSEALPTDMEEQAAQYRALLAGRRALVVLDNASSSDQVRPLLPGSSGCLVLVTSRDRLRGLVAQEGARLLTLDILSHQEGVQLLARVAGDDRVGREPEAAGELVRLCGHLPLAVRIAAARLVTRPDLRIGELASAIQEEQDRLHVLTAEDVSIRASFGLSYKALPPAPTRMFRHLGLIAGPDFGLGVAGALLNIGPDEAEGLLEDLVDRHLVETAPGSRRYRFHDLLRLYARERVQDEESECDRRDALLRMFDWYLGTAEAANQLFYPDSRLPRYSSGGQRREPFFTMHAEVPTWFEAERSNLMAAIYQAADCGLHATAWQLPNVLRHYFHRRKLWLDWQDAHEVGLTAARVGRDLNGEGIMLTNLGEVCLNQRRFEETVSHLQQALLIFRNLGNQRHEARVLTYLGTTHVDLKRSDEAFEYQRQALQVLQELGDQYEEGWALAGLGWVHEELRRFDEAIDCRQQALSIFEAIGDYQGQGIVFQDLGATYTELERFTEAADCYQHAVDRAREGLATYRADKNRVMEAMMSLDLGEAVRELGYLEEAIEQFREALSIFREIGDRWGECRMLDSLGEVFHELKRPQVSAIRESRER